jgi:hypothetical protein
VAFTTPKFFWWRAPLTFAHPRKSIGVFIMQIELNKRKLFYIGRLMKGKGKNKRKKFGIGGLGTRLYEELKLHTTQEEYEQMHSEWKVLSPQSSNTEITTEELDKVDDLIEPES